MKKILIPVYFCESKKNLSPVWRKIRSPLRRTHLFSCVYVFGRMLRDEKSVHNISLQGTIELKIDLTFSRLICLNKLD